MAGGGVLRRGALGALALSLGLSVLAGGASAAGPTLRADDMALGNPRAPVTVIEYASVGCPHCGTWAREVFPAFRKTWIDTGKARFVFREMLFGDPDLAAAGFLTARCAGPGKYFQVVDAIFAAQPKIAAGAEPAATLRGIAKDAGLNGAQFDACVADKGALAALQARGLRHETVDKITGTPTFVVGARTLEGEQSLAQLGAAIAAARPR
ncbi:MAG: DsbA family protein [Pseudomonadota bacterium]|nr:DsbA family protein [Pseudomonadota bacterium]